MKFSLLIVFTGILISCGDDYTPKPRAFLKIDLPKKENIEIKVECPFVFEKSIYSVLEKKQQECFCLFFLKLGFDPLIKSWGQYLQKLV